MKQDKLNSLVEKQLSLCVRTLTSKSEEYAKGDRLSAFNSAASLEKCTAVNALAGMMAKHTVSIYEMCNDFDCGVKASMAKWDEKITDHINYLLLLKALLVDDEDRKEVMNDGI